MTRRVRSSKNCREIIEQLAPSRYIDAVDDPIDAGDRHDPHVYIGERCIRCAVNIYDVGIYPGLEDCPGKLDDEQITYSTTRGRNQSPLTLDSTNERRRRMGNRSRRQTISDQQKKPGENS